MTRLLVSAAGGHLTELLLLAPRLRPEADEVWVTFESQQSHRLLAGREVEYVADSPPRHWASVTRNASAALRLIRKYRATEIVTNGAGIALSFAPAALATGTTMHYIECAARQARPSLTGRLLNRVPYVRLYAQNPSFAKGRWRYEGCVLDPYSAVGPPIGGMIRNVVVTVGTLDFSFQRLVDRLKAILPVDVYVVLQIGVDSNAVHWPGALVCSSLPPDQLSEAMARADVVVAHAGIGSALTALEAGKVPVLVPRLKRFKEHVDDHQLELAHTLEGKGLAVAADATTISLDHLARAGGAVEHDSDSIEFMLR